MIVEPSDKTVCAAALRRVIPAFRITGRLHRALNDAFRRFHPRHPSAPPGLVGGPAVWPEVSLDFRGGTLAELLQAFARASPGFVAVVREIKKRSTQTERCQFEYFYLQGRLATGWEIPVSNDR